MVNNCGYKVCVLKELYNAAIETKQYDFIDSFIMDKFYKNKKCKKGFLEFLEDNYDVEFNGDAVDFNQMYYTATEQIPATVIQKLEMQYMIDVLEENIEIHDR